MLQHTIKNRTVFCRDNIDILQNINSNTIDLIYLDPPFNKKRTFHAPIGSKAEGAKFKDIWQDADTKEGYVGYIADLYPKLYQYLRGIEAVAIKSDRNYLVYMAQRLIELHRILKDTGSIYFHCDPTMSHYIKLLMDVIFGQSNFRNEIVWQRNDGRGKGSQYESKKYGSNTDSILFYTKTNKHRLKPVLPLTEEEISEKFNKTDEQGWKYYSGIPVFRSRNMGDRPNLCFTWKGFKNPYPSGWRLSKARLDEEYKMGNIVITEKGTLERRKYLRDYAGKPLDNNWTDIPRVLGEARTDYPTQKPLALLERIIKASSNEGDVVLDPFCGCATTCIAAERLKRQWVGIDVSKKAFDLVQERLIEEVIGIDAVGNQDMLKRDNAVILREDIPQRTDITDIDLSYRSNKVETKHTLYDRQEGVCSGCKLKFEYRHFEIDHIVPVSKGGGDNIENLQLLCNHCNRIKSSNAMSYLVNYLKINRIGGYR